MDDARPARDSLGLLLDHFAAVPDPRVACKVRYPLSEVLFLVTCATIAACDDYDEIADWGAAHLPFLREHGEYYFGTPGEDWLRTVMNRIDPALFEACFLSWAKRLRPDAPGIIALDGKTLRRSGEAVTGQDPLHLVSAWATSERLVLAQEPVAAKLSECTGLLAILARLPLKGALVTIDAGGTNAKVAEAVLSAGGDYMLALKRNQRILHAGAVALFRDPASTGLPCHETLEKDHGRLETRAYRTCHEVDWYPADRRYPDAPRLPGIRCLVEVTARTERAGKTTEEVRYFVSSASLTPERAAEAIRGHWGIESMHWVLDVIFKEDQSRLRRGHGARNMALVRRFAFNLVRLGRGKRSMKTARKAAAWDPRNLTRILAAC